MPISSVALLDNEPVFSARRDCTILRRSMPVRVSLMINSFVCLLSLSVRLSQTFRAVAVHGRNGRGDDGERDHRQIRL